MDDSQHAKPIITTIFGGVIDSENNKRTQFMFNKSILIQANINK